MIEFDDLDDINEDDMYIEPISEKVFIKQNERSVSVKPSEIDIKKTKELYEEVRDDIIKTINVTDSYFYATLTFYKNPDMMSLGENIGVVIKMNLVNSEDFKYPNLTNDRRTVHPKQLIIKDIMEVHDFEFMNDIDVVMEYFYKKLSEKMTKELLMNGIHQFKMSESYSRQALNVKY